ncbi:hypothetical protein BDQ17DRAFT_1046300 [Cyathus striatus]|nr:hypothetical protein BDQ17DRAFT_1046300 [Cyathus striatus]
MSSYSAISSTASLTVFTHQQTTSKNYDAAFGTLSLSYGFGSSGAPIVTQKASTVSQTAPSTRHYQSKNTNATANTKDYTVAFGRLAGSYGLVGGVPSVPPRKS